MSELTPITRVESYLDAIVNNGIPPTEDITRIETFLQAIYDNVVCELTPVTRIEMFLGKISGQDIELPQPITRAELYLAAIAGEDVELPENPITRLEMYLAEWADSGDCTTISGAIVEFIATRAHKLKSCVVTLEPKQDLHGYDAPWPAGGGVNKLPPAASYSSVTVNGVTVTPYPDGHYHLEKGAATENNATIRINLAKSVPVSAGMYFAPICATKNANVVIDINDSAYNRTATGFCGKASTEITDAGTGVAEVITLFVVASQSNLSLDIYPLISATAIDTFSTYSNICPISGWTGCEIPVVGKNLIDPEKRYTYQANTHRWYATDGFVLKANQTYTLSSYPSAAQVYFMSMSGVNIINGNGKCTYTPNEDVTVYFQLYSSSGASNFEVQLELGSTVTDYEPYNGNSYSVTWGDTVFGGSVEVVDGVRIVDRAIITPNINSISSPNSYGLVNCLFTLNPRGVINGSPLLSRAISNVLKSQTSLFADTQEVGFLLSNELTGYLRLNASEISNVADANAWVEANSCRIVYYVETPIETTITPTPITALKGYNAMWSDGGNIEVAVHGTPVEVETLQALNMLLGGAYHNNQTSDDVSDDEALEIILGGEQR